MILFTNERMKMLSKEIHADDNKFLPSKAFFFGSMLKKQQQKNRTRSKVAKGTCNLIGKSGHSSKQPHVQEYLSSVR